MWIEDHERAALLPAAENLAAAWQQTLDDPDWFGDDADDQAQRAERQRDCSIVLSVVADLELDPPWSLTADPAELRWLLSYLRHRAGHSLSRPTGSRNPLTGQAAAEQREQVDQTMTLSVVCGDLLARIDELDHRRHASHFS